MIAHGNVEFEWVGNILIYKLQGAFNEEGILRLVTERKKVSAQKDYQQWFRIIYMSDDALSSPEVIKMGAVMEQKSKSDGCVDSIYVIPNECLRRIRQHQEKAFGGESNYCDTIEQAIAVFSKRSEFISD